MVLIEDAQCEIELNWNEVKWLEVKWSEIDWNGLKWTERNVSGWNKMKGNERERDGMVMKWWWNDTKCLVKYVLRWEEAEDDDEDGDGDGAEDRDEAEDWAKA
jgi:hypothetical protein